MGAAGRRKPNAIADRSAERFDGELHGGHRPNPAALGARSAGIAVMGEVTAQIGRTFQATSPLVKPCPLTNPDYGRKY
jgi:hypothetical protein